MVEFSQKQAHRNSVKYYKQMRAFGAISAAIGKILKIFPSLQRIKNANENIDCGIS